jgi:hypothetical protein
MNGEVVRLVEGGSLDPWDMDSSSERELDPWEMEAAERLALLAWRRQEAAAKEASAKTVATIAAALEMQLQTAAAQEQSQSDDIKASRSGSLTGQASFASGRPLQQLSIADNLERSSNERASMDHDPGMCDARVWRCIKGKTGMAVQCTGTTGDAKKEGGLCNRCANPGKILWLGRMDEAMPSVYPEPVYRKPDFEGDDMGPKGKDAHYLMQDAKGRPIKLPVEEHKKRGRKPGSKNKKKKSYTEEDQAAEIARLKAMLSAKAEKADYEGY